MVVCLFAKIRTTKEGSVWQNAPTAKQVEKAWTVKEKEATDNEREHEDDKKVKKVKEAEEVYNDDEGRT